MLLIMLMIKKIMGFEGNCSKLPLPLQMTIKKKYLNIHLENLRPQINIENDYKQSDERYQINMIYKKDSDERYQIGENKEEKLNTDIEVLKW